MINPTRDSASPDSFGDAVVDGSYLVEGTLVDAPASTGQRPDNGSPVEAEIEAEIIAGDEMVDRPDQVDSASADATTIKDEHVDASTNQAFGNQDANIAQLIQRWPQARGLSWRNAAFGDGHNTTALRWASNPETSFTHYQNAGFWAKDEVLQFWLWALAAEIPEHTGTPTWLIAAKQYWEHESQISGCGYVLPQLNYLVSTVAQARQLLPFVLQAQRRITALGRWVSRQHLMQNQIAGSGFRWPDGGLSTELVLAVARDFTALLESSGAAMNSQPHQRLLAQ